MTGDLSPVWREAPRFGPERAFPPYRFVPGEHPHPVRDPQGHSHGQEEAARHVPPDRWREDEDYLRGIDLYHAGYLWEAHEAWEGIWKASPDETQRDFLQGLIQLAAALLKLHVGEQKGARGLAAAARDRLARVAAQHECFMGLGLDGLLAPLESLAWDRAPRLRIPL